MKKALQITASAIVSAMLLAFGVVVLGGGTGAAGSGAIGGGGGGGSSGDTRYLMLDASNDPVTGKLHLSSTTPLSAGSNAAQSSDFAGGALVLDNDAFFTTAQINVHSDDANPAFLLFSKTRGTHAAPAALHSSDGLGSIYWSGFGTGYTFVADIRPFATETWDGTHHGTAMFLETNKKADAGSNTWTLGDTGLLTAPSGNIMATASVGPAPVAGQIATWGNQTTLPGELIGASSFTFDGSLLTVNTNAGAISAGTMAGFSSSTTGFTLEAVNSQATNGGLVCTKNDAGDTTYFGTTGSTGFTVAGSTRAHAGLIQSNTSGGIIINEFANASIRVATNDTVRETLDGAGHLTIAAPTATDAGSGTCTSVTVSANDRIGTVTATCLAGQTVKVNFGSAYSSAPTCISGAATDASATTTQMTITALVALTAAPVEFRCDIKG